MSKKEQTPLRAGRPSAGKPPKTLKDLRDSPEMVRMTLDIDKERHTRLKVYAALHGKTIAAVIREIIDGLDISQTP